MNYISYLEIHAPQQQQPSVSRDSIKSTDPKFDWKFDQSKFGQTVQTTQSMDSLQTKPKLDQKFNQTAQEEHRVATEAKSGAAHEPKSPQVSWCKNSITIDGKTHPLPTTKEYILHEYADVFNSARWSVPHKVKRLLQASPASTEISPFGNAICIQSRVR